MTRTPRLRGLLDLWAAHRELSALEWLEFRETIVAALVWLVFACVGALAGWLLLNVAVFIYFRERPLEAALILMALNALGGVVAAFRASQLLRRPFFALTKREAGRDVSKLVEVLS
jgi:hypothetical protein